MNTVEKIDGWESLNSRGNPCLTVKLTLKDGRSGCAMVPSGASCGEREALELLDHDPQRFHGKGLQKALHAIKTIQKEVVGQTFASQKTWDSFLCDFDGSVQKSKLGGNTLLSLSLAFARACAGSLPLYHYLQTLFSVKNTIAAPIPFLNVINGGAHADNPLFVQEFMLCPTLGKWEDRLRAGSEIYHHLKKLLRANGLTTNVGDEGGFAPNITSNAQCFDLLLEAIEKAGYQAGKEVFLAIDVAASEFYKNHHYCTEKKYTAAQWIETLVQWKNTYPLLSIEDGCDQNDWSSWKQLTAHIGATTLIVGDDLFVTNTSYLQKGIDAKAANALLVKPNQIGTLSETIQAIECAHKNSWKTIVSHRSGDTEDSFISDLTIAAGSYGIKSGAPCRSERTAKYNRITEIFYYNALSNGTAQTM